MAIWSRGGQTPRNDVRGERIAAGTVGGEFVQPQSLGGKKALAVVDNYDPRILYGASGAGTASFGQFGSLPFTQQNGQTVIGLSGGADIEYSAASFHFTGTSIAVIGSINPLAGTMQVYIDGVLTQGRVPIYCGLPVPSDINAPTITATDTSITTFGSTANFAASGRLFLNGELIDYSSKGGTSFTGLTRGVGGTTAVAHYSNETVYLWDSSIGLYSTGWATKQILYYNPLLEPGEHTIVIVGRNNASSGNSRIYFDAFLTGSLLGASNVFTQIATITITDTTDGNGHLDIGQFTQINSDVAPIAVLGYSQVNCETSNMNTMGTLGVKYAQNGLPTFYLHNGPLSALITIIITFAYLGESI